MDIVRDDDNGMPNLMSRGYDSYSDSGYDDDSDVPTLMSRGCNSDSDIDDDTDDDDNDVRLVSLKKVAVDTSIDNPSETCANILNKKQTK